jgi:hypothetical protein
LGTRKKNQKNLPQPHSDKLFLGCFTLESTSGKPKINQGWLASEITSLWVGVPVFKEFLFVAKSGYHP